MTWTEYPVHEIDTISPREASVVRWPDGWVTLLIEDPIRGDLGIAMTPESAQELSKFLSGE